MYNNNTLTFDANTPDEVIKKTLAVEAEKDQKIEYNGHTYITEAVTESEEIYGPNGIYPKAQEALARAIYLAENGNIDEDTLLYTDSIENLLEDLEEALEDKTPEERDNIISQALDNPGQYGYGEDGYRWSDIDSLLQDLESEIYEYITDTFLYGEEFVTFNGRKYLVGADEDCFWGSESIYNNNCMSLIYGIQALTEQESLDLDNTGDYADLEIQGYVDKLAEMLEIVTDEEYDKALNAIKSFDFDESGYEDPLKSPFFFTPPVLSEEDIEGVLEALQENVVSCIRDNA